MSQIGPTPGPLTVEAPCPCCGRLLTLTFRGLSKSEGARGEILCPSCGQTFQLSVQQSGECRVKGDGQ